MASSTTLQIKDSRDLFTLIGDGKYQLWIFVLGLVTTIPCAIQEFLLNFVALDGGWECVRNSSVCRLNGTRPADDNFRCTMNRTEWKYHGTKTFSIVNEFELSCDQEYWIPLSTALFYIANLCGAPILGGLIDKYSRSRTIFTCVTVVLATCFGAAFVQSLWLFQLLRIVNGFFLPGTYMGMIILTSEIVSEKYRNVVVSAYLSAYPLGVALFGLIAYYVQDWRRMMIYVSAPYFGVLIFLWFLPEPFLWLYDNGQYEKLRTQLKGICRINNVQLSSTSDITFVKKLPTTSDHNSKKEDSKKSEASGFIALFCPSKRMFMTLALISAFTSQGLIYYGIEQVADDLTGNLYRDFILLILAELLSTAFSFLTSDRFGRKYPTVSSYLFGGTCMVAIGFTPTGKPSLAAIRLALALSAKIFTSAGYTLLILWSVELYPTKLRAKANGMLNCVYCFGAVIAPWVGIWLLRLQRNAPFYVMGGFIALSAILLIIVPETKGKGLAKEEEEDEEDCGMDGVEMEPQNKEGEMGVEIKR